MAAAQHRRRGGAGSGGRRRAGGVVVVRQGPRHVRGPTDGPDDLPDVHAGQGNGARAHALKWQRYPKPEDPTGFTQ